MNNNNNSNNNNSKSIYQEIDALLFMAKVNGDYVFPKLKGYQHPLTWSRPRQRRDKQENSSSPNPFLSLFHRTLAV